MFKAHCLYSYTLRVINVDAPQYGNLDIFLALIFYVKSTFFFTLKYDFDACVFLKLAKEQFLSPLIT